MNVTSLVALCVVAQANSSTSDSYEPSALVPNEMATCLPDSSPSPVVESDEPQPTRGVDTPRVAKVCSLNVPDMDLAKIVRILADQTETNIILMAKQDARLTIRLDNVTLPTMLRHICALSGLSMLDVDDTYVIATEDLLKSGYPEEWASKHPVKAEPKPETITETLELKYVKAGQVAAALAKMYPADMLSVIVGPEQKSPSLEDQKVTVGGGEATMLGGNNSSGGVEAGRSETESTAKTILLRGAKDVVESAVSAVKKFDIARPQVSIAVTVHEVTNEAVKELGLGWNFSNLVIRDRRVSTGSGGGGSTTVDNGGAFDPLSATATIKALETANKARLLASPTVSVLDGERGYVLIGDRIKYPVVTTFSQANTPVFDVREDRVGIYLQVAANIATDKDITLSLYPQVSTITGFLNVNGASYPQISTREAQTTIRLKSGETVVMAGLLRDDQVERTEKVPILGDIPLLGELFKLRKKSKTGTQLVITITPIVMEGKAP